MTSNMHDASQRADPILLELYRHRFAGIAEEMGVTLRRTGYSPNIKERLDFSCAVFDAGGRLVAQAAHVPVHLGAMPASVRAALDAFDVWDDGDLVVLNDPYQGGSHLPDVTMVSPVFEEGTSDDAAPAFFAASRAHHADVGGMSPGSLPLSTEIYQEGIIIPPVKLYRGGALNEDLLRFLLRNVRTPKERQGDLAAQRAAHAVGAARLQELMQHHGAGEVDVYAGHLIAYSDRLTRAAIAGWPDGEYGFEDVLTLDMDSDARPVTIRVKVSIQGDSIRFDFGGTEGAVAASFNAVLSITQSACYYVVRSLAGDDIPANAGCFVPVEVTAPEGCLVHAQPPAAVAAGNVETSQRIVDVVLGALAQALPDRVPAASQGTMNNLTIGGQHGGVPYAYYETIGGGMGGSPTSDGLCAVHVHMSNTLNTPVEALEQAFPFRVTEYRVRQGSGGQGRYRGGDGVVRAYEILAPATITVLSERRVEGPWGLQGGEAGAPGRNRLLRADGTEEVLPSKFTRLLQPGDRLIIETPGGGGFGQTSDEARLFASHH